MANVKRTPLLDLDNLVERRTVKFGGEEYDLLNPDEVSILDYHKIVKHARQVSEVAALEDANEAQVKRLSDALAESCKIVLRAPDEVHAKFTDMNRLAIISVFSDLQRVTPAPAEAKDETTAPATETSTSEI